MSTKRLVVLRRRVLAFIGATFVVVALWLITVLAVDLFAQSSLLGVRAGRFVKVVGGVKQLVLPGTAHRHGPIVVFLRRAGGNPSDFSAWHTVVQVLILIALAALAVAGLDRLRRTGRRRRRLRIA
jgi:Trk-type K+ transport system membrane component